MRFCDPRGSAEKVEHIVGDPVFIDGDCVRVGGIVHDYPPRAEFADDLRHLVARFSADIVDYLRTVRESRARAFGIECVNAYRDGYSAL